MIKDAIRYGSCCLICSVLMLSPITTSWGSVTIMGSRIIYPSDAPSVDVRLKNNDMFPYVIQTWFDEGNVNAGPQNSYAIPFVTTPPLFRMQPKAGQVVRIVYSKSKSLPQDRESVFWLNALQVPPANIGSDQKQNKMLVMLRTRIKLFYRPAELRAPGNLAKKLQVKAVYDTKNGTGIAITNPNPWFASVTNLTTTISGTTHALKANMISPFTSQTFWLSGKVVPKQIHGMVKVTLVNDHGARMSEKYDVIYP